MGIYPLRFSHHLMLDAGFTPTWILVVLVTFSLLCGAVVGQAMRIDVPHPVLLAAFLALCGGWYWLTARRTRALQFFRGLRGERVKRKRDDAKVVLVERRARDTK